MGDFTIATSGGVPITLNTTLTAYKIPLSAIALWPAFNEVNPERRHWLVPFAFSLQVLATLAVAGRLYGRITRKAGSFGADDVLIIASWVGIVYLETGTKKANPILRFLACCSQACQFTVRYVSNHLRCSLLIMFNYQVSQGVDLTDTYGMFLSVPQ
jgi:hypothetical protein